jgi:hypothetical protein
MGGISVRGPDASEVLSLVVLAGAAEAGSVTEDSQVLMTVRDPLNNRTHPGVVSVPTIRLPVALAVELRKGRHARSQFGATELFDCVAMNSWDADGHSPIVFAVRTLLCQKLGVADALESGGLLFSAGVAASSAGWSYYDDQPLPSGEFIRMTTLMVFITRGVGMFTTQTASYSSVAWCKVGKFLRAARVRDVSMLGYDPVGICIHGLCIVSAHDVLAAKLGYEPYPKKRDGGPHGLSKFNMAG